MANEESEMLLQGGTRASSLPSRLTINESVIHATLDDEALVLDVEQGLYFGLGGVGARIWELLEQPSTEEEIVRQLLEEYEAEPAHVRAAVRDFLQLLAAKGLTREVHG
jgi:hypothetical protein